MDTELIEQNVHRLLGAMTGAATATMAVVAGRAGFSRFRQVTQTPVSIVLELRP